MANLQLKDGNGTLYNFQVSGDGSAGNPFIPLSDLSVAGAPVSNTHPLPSSNVADWILNRLLRAVARLTFDVSNQLRVAGPVTVSSGTVTTVTTMATGNIGMGDMGKPSTSIVFSRQLTANSTRRNLIRS